MGRRILVGRLTQPQFTIWFNRTFVFGDGMAIHAVNALVESRLGIQLGFLLHRGIRSVAAQANRIFALFGQAFLRWIADDLAIECPVNGVIKSR